MTDFKPAAIGGCGAPDEARPAPNGNGAKVAMFGAVNTSRLSWLRCACWAFLAGMATAAPAWSAEDDDVDQPRERLLTLNHVDAYLELKSEYSRQHVQYDRRGLLGQPRSQKNTDLHFEERIGLALGGTVVDPSFITFNGDFSFALTQDRYEERLGRRDDTDKDTGYLLQYDARINFFTGKQISGSVYALKQEDRINRAFQSTLDVDRKGFGTSWVFAHDKIPMELSYDYLETDLTGNDDGLDNEHYTSSTFHYGARWLISDHHHLDLSYEHAKNKQDYQGSPFSYETTRDLFIIDHQLEFGDTYQHEFRTRVHWQEESGDFARDFFEIGPQLTLRHTDDLQTIWKYQFNRERYEGLDVETQRADVSLIHQLYTNLTTTVNVFGLYEDVENDINTTQYGALVDWQYNRKNPYGQFFANLALAYDTEEVDGDNGQRLILDESQTFRDPVAILLRNQNVVEQSIVVTDAANRRIYRKAIDYIVVRQGTYTRLVRNRTGDITDGQTILVDYQFRTPTDGQIDTIRVDFSMEQRFENGLRPYYRWSYRDQDADWSSGFARRADRTDHHRLGVNYEQKRYSLGTEFEVFDDTVDPYDAFHLNGRLNLVDSAEQQVVVSARFSRFCFEGGHLDRDVDMIDVGLDHRWRLTDAWSTVERVAYRFEDDSAFGETIGWDVVAGLEYVVGDLSGELTFEYDRLELPDSNEEDIGVYFRIRRDIPNVLARQ